jgi:SAM-dependent methyltransferase
VCRAKLECGAEQIRCVSRDCGAVFPTVRGIPILLNEKRSLFRIADISQQSRAPLKKRKWLLAMLRRLMPSLSANIRAQQNFLRIRDLLLRGAPHPRVLVVGAGTLGEGFGSLLADPMIELVETDVTLGPRVSLVCDAHDLPFEDGSFDAVIAQAVLEHVVDPDRCVEEIHRVLRPAGIVYAETPFMQQVHLGRFDFTRFTHLGHRRLFRRFEELRSGAACGPGMALAWSYQYFLLSFSASKPIRQALKAFASITSFYLKYFDYFLIDRPGAYDAASGFYFLGRRTDQVLTDRELVGLYRGAV